MYVVLLVLFIGENADLLYQELTSDDDRADRGNLRHCSVGLR
jgi:hypothetical protein